jgi:NADH-quinone oxidoreductase subunit J
MGVTQILFYFLSLLAIVCAIMVIASKNPVHSVLYLIGVFFAISGHYILLNAQFLAVVNIIVYAGAIMVLFLFVVMLMNLNKESEKSNGKLSSLVSVLASGLLLLVLIAGLKDANAFKTNISSKYANADQLKKAGIAASDTTERNIVIDKMVTHKDGEIGLIKVLGQKLFTDYVVPFEISSILFLSAILGAVILGKKDKTKPEEVV